MDQQIAGKPVVLLSGASQGIGRAIAHLLGNNGFRIFGTSRHPETADPIPGVTFLPLDVHAPDSIQACVQTVMETAGRIDILINNAGIGGPGTASEETDIESVHQLFETNFYGVIRMTNAVLPVMRAQGSGLVINISSIAGQIPLPPFQTFYSASKHALEAYTEGLRYEVRPFGIRVAMVEPGYTSTGFGKTIQPPNHPLPVYEPRRKASILMDETAIHYGTDAGDVAQTVLNVIRDPQPALHNPVGVDSIVILLIRRFLPSPLFERFGEWLFLSWRPRRALLPDEYPDPQELGLHRFFIHKPSVMRMLRTSATSLLITAGVGLGFVLFRRSRR